MKQKITVQILLIYRIFLSWEKKMPYMSAFESLRENLGVDWGLIQAVQIQIFRKILTEFHINLINQYNSPGIERVSGFNDINLKWTCKN
jgi:hypothetical protein